MKFFAFVIANIVALVAHAGDIQGAADHALVPRYPESEICAFEAREYEEYQLVNGPAISRDKIPRQQVNGRTLRNMYVLKDENRSTVEVMRNYEIALEEAGFEAVFACAGEACAQGAAHRTYFFFRANPNLKFRCRLPDLADWSMPQKEPRYFAAKLQRPGQPETHVAITVAAWSLRGGSGPRYVYVQADIIEAEQMRVAMEVKLAKEIDADLTKLGHATIYGIQFGYDSAEIEPSSQPALAEIATYLNDNPSNKMLVVGHTDDQGSLAYNRDLSKRRAQAVALHLIDRYKINADRLEGHGVGYLAPAASNSTENGRALNRRVELLRSTNP